MLRADLSARQRFGLAIISVGALALMFRFFRFVHADPVVWSALLGGSVAALATALGTLPVLFSQKLPDRLQDTLFGFGAGVMLAACAFSLIIPGLEAARSAQVFGGGSWAAGGVVGSAILLGGAALKKNKKRHRKDRKSVV